MPKDIDKLAERLGAKVVGKVPATGGGAFGAARLGATVATLQSRLRPSQGKRPGRPTDPTWDRSPKVPMSRRTAAKLALLAQRASKTGRQVSPMQLAAQLLEDVVAQL
ncbi:MAG TPA: hypothetical protein VHZ24_17180 [Pirellulales bacterium]|jgi:phage tail tape-measure protein|nr:hypothetical protein [Pirellulales bacterium]